MSHKLKSAPAALILLAGLAVAPSALGAALVSEKSRPRLGVVVVFDQLRAHDLERLRPLFGNGGFGGLEARGAAVHTGRYFFGAAETGPGHATIATGANPSLHGIPVNRWPEGDGLVYCVEDPRHPTLGRKDGQGRSARYLAIPNLADTLRADSHGKAKVVSLSLKDRAAILMGGHAANVAVWYDRDLGMYTTSEAYAASLPGWVVHRR